MTTKKQLILFIGDYVKLRENFYGPDSQWLKVIDVEPYDICLLSNGKYNSIRVCASYQYIADAKSEMEWEREQDIKFLEEKGAM